MAEPLALHELIRRQGSVVSLAQALRAGLSRHAIDYRLRDGGPWQVLLPGVYLTTSGVPTQTQRETAAILGGGQHAVLTGVAALRFFGLRQIPGLDRDAVDILIPAKLRRASMGYVRVHRTSHMPAWVEGPSARRFALPARAVVDTARWLTDLREVRALIGDAVQNSHCATAQLTEELLLGGTRSSALARKAITESVIGVRSAPEAELRDLIIRATLPMPLFNSRLYQPNGTFIACPDAWWPDAGVALEIDSRQWHLAPDDWERTMSRHSDLGQYGIVTLHVTPHQLRSDPAPFMRKAANAYRAGQARPRLNVFTLPAAA